MKPFMLLVAGSSLAAIIGCGSGTPGGPGAATPTKQTPLGAENTFKLDVPTFPTTIKQGETKTITVGIKRMTNFSEDVLVKLGTLPKGLTASPTSEPLKHGSDNVKFTLTAAADAALGDFTVDVIGHPGKGPDATTSFRVTISK